LVVRRETTKRGVSSGVEDSAARERGDFDDHDHDHS